MRHLIRFNESLDLVRLKSNILDIFVEFKDRKLAVNVVAHKNLLYILIETVYSTNVPISKPINISEDLPIFEMLFDYLSNKYKLSEIRWYLGSNNVTCKLSKEDNDIETFKKELKSKELKSKELTKIALQFNPSKLTQQHNETFNQF